MTDNQIDIIARIFFEEMQEELEKKSNERLDKKRYSND